MKEINKHYKNLCSALLNGHKVGNTRELSNIQFTLEDINDNVITFEKRGLNIPYILGELSWYFKGDNSVNYINKFGKMWNKLSDDGVTNNSAYGYLLKYKHGFDQIELIIDLLKTDYISRRAVLNINVPNPHVIETHDEPCTIALQFLMRDNKLHCTGIMRSNDIWFGLPYDVIFFTELQKYIARRLNVEYGTYTHFVVSLHLYDKDFNDVLDIATKQVVIDYPKFNFQKLIDNVDEIHSAVNESSDPKVDIVKICQEKGVL